jgi:hypothetical protein
MQIDDAHDEGRKLAALVARSKTKRDAQQHRRRDRQDTDQQRGASAPDHPTQNIATLRIHAKDMIGRANRCETQRRVGNIRIIWCNPGCCDRDRHDGKNEHQTGQHQPVACQAMPAQGCG